MLALHLDRNLETRLDRIARATGQTRSWIVQQAVAQYVREAEAQRAEMEAREEQAA